MSIIRRIRKMMQVTNERIEYDTQSNIISLMNNWHNITYLKVELMANLSSEYALPLKVVSNRLNHMKNGLSGIIKRAEERAVYNQNKKKDKTDEIQFLLTWDDWIYSALDANHEIKQAKLAKQNESAKQASVIEKMLLNYHTNKPLSHGLNKPVRKQDSVYDKAMNNMLGHLGIKARKPAWAENLQTGEHIPKELLEELPVTTGELVTLGNWMLTKNIYRFDDLVINELIKTGFKGIIPNYIIHLPDLCVYVQLDNTNLIFENAKLLGVLFCITEIVGQKVLVNTLYLDNGLPRTIAITLNNDQDVESSITDFVDEFQQDYNPEIMKEELNARLELQKKLINIVLWFSQKKPEIEPLFKGENTPVKFTTVKKDKRLFEASKYKTFKVGNETATIIKKAYAEIEEAKKKGGYAGKDPHLRKAHWHLYWYGKKGQYEKYDLRWLSSMIVGGVPKNK